MNEALELQAMELDTAPDGPAEFPPPTVMTSIITLAQ